mmetsp:Transcript_47848/g.107396  ORF Transcript_47848/g.107396 Transcript_47848/m.107396 type:complete len:234 (-) Transcript_47848:9-710(-)
MASKPAAGLVFMHGSGDCGEGVELFLSQISGGLFVRRLEEAGVRMVYPDAPTVPYSLMRGEQMPVWFDRVAMAYEAPEDGKGIARSVGQIDSEIDALVALGIPESRIAVAGFSMGGCLALHVGYGTGKYSRKLAAVAAMSTFLSKDSQLDAALKAAEGTPAPPLFLAHGKADGMIDPKWAKATRDRLQAAGVDVPPEIRFFEGLDHYMCKEELEQLADFLLEHLAGASCKTSP